MVYYPSKKMQHNELLFAYTQYQLSLPSVLNFEKGRGGRGGGVQGIRKTMSAWGDLKYSCHRYLPRELTVFLSKKTF